MDEINNDTDLDLDLTDEEKKPRRDQRVDKALSEKAKAEEERDKTLKALEKQKAETEALKKDIEFNKNFSAVSSKYQGASEFQDKIKELADKGYDLEHAAVAVLNQEGKFTSTPLPKENPAGGSAGTQVTKGTKSIGEMTQAEKREILKDSLELTL